VGLGKIGLPIAAQYAFKGHRVIGADVNSQVVELVNQGQSHVVGEPMLQDRLADAVAQGRMSATTDTTAAVSQADVVVVAVPLMMGVNGQSDFRSLDDATERIGRGARPGTLVIYETTLPLGTTRVRLAPKLVFHSGLRLGDNLFVAFSPERVYSGRIFRDLALYPKIVGGIDSASTELAADFYRAMLDVKIRAVGNAETAEFAKLAETTYRFVNIALADELAVFGRARGIDVAEAFEAANTQPFSSIHQPSIGVGGHCIPVYPRFLLEAALPEELSIVRDAHKVNDLMAVFYVRWLETALGGLRDKRVIVLGACYRPNVRETALSAVFPVVEQLRLAGVHTLVHDPLLSIEELTQLGFQATTLETPIRVDAVIVQAFHKQYHGLDWGARFTGLRVVVDGRGEMSPDTFVGTGIVYLSLGATLLPGTVDRPDIGTAPVVSSSG
jgi:nucleotide sugar dehydrogenase